MSDLEFWKPVYQLFQSQKALMGQELNNLYVKRDRSPAERIARQLEREPEPTTFLLTGHVGSGKTTELKRLERDAGRSYIVVWVNTETNLDRMNIGYAEVVVLIGVRIAEQLRELGWSIPPKLSQALTESLARVTYQSREEAGGALQLPKVLQDLGAMLKVGFQRDMTRTIDVRPAMSGILSAVNAIIHEAEQDKQKMVVVVDGLDKLDYKIGKDAFCSRLLADLKCHVVYTIPIALRYSSAFNEVREVFPITYDLANPPVFKCDDESRPTSNKDKDGRFLLKKVIEKRLAVLDDRYKTLFTPDALELLCEKSGGVFRDLIRLTYDAFEIAEENQKRVVDLAVAKATVRATQSFITIPDYYYPELDHIHRTGQPSSRIWHSPTKGEVVISNELLGEKLVLGYDAPLGGTWFDIHPLLIEKLELWRQSNSSSSPLNTDENHS